MFEDIVDEDSLKNNIKFIIIDKKQKELYFVLLKEDESVKGLIGKKTKIGFSFNSYFSLKNEYMDSCLSKEIFDVTKNYDNAIKWLIENK